jgi:hypothetical protein
MGVSTNALIAFGFDLGEELPEKMQELFIGGDGFDFDKVVVIDTGIFAPAEEYSDATKEVYSEHWAAVREARERFPITIEEHCSGDYPMFFLAIARTVQSARRGCPEVMRKQEITEQQITELRNFCVRWGIDWQEPDWYLFSYWG